MILGEPIILSGGGGIPCIVTIATAPNATLKATLGNTTITATSDSSGVAVFTLEKTGVWNIEVMANGETKTITIDTTFEKSGNLLFADSVLANNDWATISTIAKSGMASQIWKVGDIKSTNIQGTEFPMRIIGFDHDEVVNSTSYGRPKAGITFQFESCYVNSFAMNSSNTNVNGWGNSSLRTSTIAYFSNTELANVLVTVKKPYCATRSSANLSYSQDKMFLLSEAEVFGGSPYYAPASEGSQYEFYKAGNSKFKKRKSAGATHDDVTNEWLRSVNRSNDSDFVTIAKNAANGYGTMGASNKNHFAPAFCI